MVHFRRRTSDIGSASAFPQLAQNFRPVLLSVPHFAQRIFAAILPAQFVE
jgi:hypothetical protein